MRRVRVKSGRDLLTDENIDHPYPGALECWSRAGEISQTGRLIHSRDPSGSLSVVGIDTWPSPRCKSSERSRRGRHGRMAVGVRTRLLPPLHISARSFIDRCGDDRVSNFLLHNLGPIIRLNSEVFQISVHELRRDRDVTPPMTHEFSLEQ
jgi:hypothetical protein